jgi:uncharacterized protein (UPF0548 family)
VDHNRVRVGSGRQAFQRAVAALRSWQQFELRWVSLVPNDAPIKVGTTVVVKAHTFGVWSLNATRIVYVINEIDPIARFGFGYGTLPDHVETGEERFLIEWTPADDSVCYDILAFSKPRQQLVLLGKPVARFFQRRFATDSIAAMRSLIH